MGQDLILTALAVKNKSISELNWQAGRDSIAEHDFDSSHIETAIELDWIDVDEDASEEELQSAYREHLVDLVDQLEKGFVEGDRTLSWLTFGDWEIHLCGGSTWGDSPSSLFNTIIDLIDHTDEVLKPIGFDWPERE